MDAEEQGWAVLPLELQEMVLQHLSGKELLLSVSLVCSEWYSMVHHQDSLWIKLCGPLHPSPYNFLNKNKVTETKIGTLFILFFFSFVLLFLSFNVWKRIRHGSEYGGH